MSMTDPSVWALQTASCFFMCGVISIIQFVHYPCFAQIDRARFAEFHTQHTNALGYIAAPAMIIELGSASWIALSGDAIPLLNLASVLALWGVTFGLSVPAHNRLAKGFDEDAAQRLLRTNWLRTALWYARGAIFLWVAIQ